MYFPLLSHFNHINHRMTHCVCICRSTSPLFTTAILLGILLIWSCFNKQMGEGAVTWTNPRVFITPTSKCSHPHILRTGGIMSARAISTVLKTFDKGLGQHANANKDKFHYVLNNKQQTWSFLFAKELTIVGSLNISLS